MRTIKFNCPHCQQRLGAAENLLGRKISCPICKGHIKLPEAPTPTPKEEQSPSAASPTLEPQQQSAQTAPLPPLTAAFQPPTPPPAAIPVEKPQPGFGSTTVPVTLSNGDITFYCPNCSCKLIVTERAAGKKIPCRKCGVPVTVPTAASIPPDPAGRQTVNLTFRQDAQASLNDLVKRVREGDAAAAKAILAFGSHAVPIVIEGLENSFAEPKENRAAGCANGYSCQNRVRQRQTPHQQTRQEPACLLCVGTDRHRRGLAGIDPRTKLGQLATCRSGLCWIGIDRKPQCGLRRDRTS